MDVIMVGLDGSASSRAALEWATDLASAVGSRVVAVHVVPTAWEWEMSALQINTERLIRERRADLNGRWIEPLRRAGVRYSTRFVEGDPGKELLRVAAREHADLIVIGTVPHGRVHDLVFGGTRHQLLTSAPCPVVLVPAHAERNRALAGASDQGLRTRVS